MRSFELYEHNFDIPAPTKGRRKAPVSREHPMTIS